MHDFKGTALIMARTRQLVDLVSVGKPFDMPIGEHDIVIQARQFWCLLQVGEYV